MMNLRIFCWFLLLSLIVLVEGAAARVSKENEANLENHISPDDLQEFLKLANNQTDSVPDLEHRVQEDGGTTAPPTDVVDCFGMGSMASKLRWLFNMRPDSSDVIDTKFYFTSRKQRNKVQIPPGEQFGLEWVDFNPKRRTVMIVHGFMSHSNATWVNDMTEAFLQWGDVNVITVDWSKGGNTWKYWRAVANTRQVGSDVTGFLQQLMNATGATVKDFHFVGHSLGAHICSYASYRLGRVARITGLDPAQPCFRTSDRTERLDDTDADFVDVIHTNGRLLCKIGFGLPEPTGHADFYPNGGMRQPGCLNYTSSIWSKLFSTAAQIQQAICSHGRSYLLFTESLINGNCSFTGHRWDLTYEDVNATLKQGCSNTARCSVMGIDAADSKITRTAKGPFFVLTTDKEPYCPSEDERRKPRSYLLRDLREGFQLNRWVTVRPNVTPAYADPMDLGNELTTTTTKPSKWFSFAKWLG